MQGILHYTRVDELGLSENSVSITASFVNKSLRDILSFLGFNSADFSSHSFRIGKATDMAKRGFTDIQICMAGRWSSAAFKKYIKPQLLQFQ